MMAETSIMLVACLCSQEIVTQSAVHAWLNSFQREIDLTYIALHPLAANDITQILDTFMQPQQRDTLLWLRNWFVDVTGGYPFYLREMFNMLIERHLIAAKIIEDDHYDVDFSALVAQQDALHSLPMPTKVQNQILQRLERLSSHARELLVACAVLYRRATFERLLTVAELTVKDGLAAIDEVLHASLLQEVPQDDMLSDAETAYCFTHEKIREVVYVQASDARRKVFHARALALLEQQAEILPAEFVYHALAGEQKATI